MIDPLAVGLKFAFVIVLYLFVLWVARGSLRDLSRVRSAVVEGTIAPPSDDGRPSPIDLRRGVRPRLVVIAGRGYDPGFLVELLEPVTLGRGADVDLHVDDPFASAHHTRLTPGGECSYVEDLGSTNGTFVNGSRLDRPRRLAPGDRIKIGDTEFRYDE